MRKCVKGLLYVQVVRVYLLLIIASIVKKLSNRCCNIEQFLIKPNYLSENDKVTTEPETLSKNILSKTLEMQQKKETGR